MDDSEGTRAQILQTTLHQIKSNDHKDGKDLSDPCVICLEQISERAITVPCNHTNFDFICLVNWLDKSETCPLCKIAVTEVQYDFASPEDYKVYKVPLKKDTSTASQSTTATADYRRRNRDRRPLRRPVEWGRAAGSPVADIAILQRRHVYRNQLYSHHVGTNRLSRFRDFTPATFRSSEELQSRARKWIRRELSVFSFLNPDSENEDTGTARRANNAEFLLEYIIAILKTVEIKGSAGQAEEMLQEFIGRDNTRLFLHELEAWLRSPYTNLEDWDRHVQYSERLPTSSDENGLPRGQRSSSAPSQGTARGKEASARGSASPLRAHTSRQSYRREPYDPRMRNRGSGRGRVWDRYVPD